VHCLFGCLEWTCSVVVAVAAAAVVVVVVVVESVD